MEPIMSQAAVGVSWEVDLRRYTIRIPIPRIGANVGGVQILLGSISGRVDLGKGHRQSNGWLLARGRRSRNGNYRRNRFCLRFAS
jgi:hypothetical protein